MVPVSSENVPEFELSIEKREIHLRYSSKVNADDVDAAAFPEHYFENDYTSSLGEIRAARSGRRLLPSTVRPKHRTSGGETPR